MNLTQLAFDASLRSLDKQEGLVHELRSRTGLLLAAASLAASFLGDAALDGSVLLAIPALVAFAVSLAGSLYVLVPKEDIVFSLAGSRIYEELRGLDDIGEAQRLLVYTLDRFWHENDAILARLLTAFRVAALALGAEVVLLLASAGTTIV